jgi:hypothetical protein
MIKVMKSRESIQGFIAHLSLNMIQDEPGLKQKIFMLGNPDKFFNDLYDDNYFIFNKFLKFIVKKKYKLNTLEFKYEFHKEEYICLYNLIKMSINNLKIKYKLD